MVVALDYIHAKFEVYSVINAEHPLCKNVFKIALGWQVQKQLLFCLGYFNKQDLSIKFSSAKNKQIIIIKPLGLISAKSWMECWRVGGFDIWRLGWVLEPSVSYSGKKTSWS